MIQNDIEIASFCLDNGVERIFIDLETLGKQERQGHLNTWKSDHVFDDIEKIRQVVPVGKLLVRLNKWNKNSKNEIKKSIENGADFLMLPMISSLQEIESFCKIVNNQVPVIPLIETPLSLQLLPEIINIKGVSEIYIGLNDLSILLNYKFCFEPLIKNYLEVAARLLNKKNIPWGFGGIARSKEGIIPPSIIIGEHVRLGSKFVILSKSFHRDVKSLKALKKEMDFNSEINKLRGIEKFWKSKNSNDLYQNKLKLKSEFEKYIKS